VRGLLSDGTKKMADVLGIRIPDIDAIPKNSRAI